MIGLVLGETQLGNLIIKKLKLLKKKFVIIDISKKKIFKKNKNYNFLNYFQFLYLKQKVYVKLIFQVQEVFDI